MADLRFFVTQEGTLNQGGSGDDSVFNFTGNFSSDTVQGLGGKDLISFANQTTAINLAAQATGISAGATLAVLYSGARVSAGSLIQTDVFTGSTAAADSAGFADVSATVQALIQTGVSGIQGGLIGGNTGNDSIYLGDQLRTFTDVFVGGGQGNDLIGTFNSGAYAASGGTAGVINANFSGVSLAGGEGNDTVFANFSGASAKDFKVAGNAGNDSVVFSGADAEVNTGLVGGGQGNDSVVIVADSGKGMTIRGGDGNDSVDANFSAGFVKGIVEGDGSTTGKDTIRLSFAGSFSSNTVDGGDGADSIVLSGMTTDGGSNLYLGGTGNDTIFFQSAGAAGLTVLSGSTIKGQMGDDSILLETESAGTFVSSIIYGNKGDDTITISHIESNGVGASAGSYAITMQGGAGADLMTNSGIGSAGGSGTFTFKSYEDSTLSGVDTILYTTAAVSAGSDTFASSQVKFNVATGDSLSLATGAGTGGKVSAASAFVIWSGYSDNSLTARVSAIDESYTTTGTVAVFTTDNADRYLFVQGGSTDIVAKLASSDALSAGLGSINISGQIIAFDG
jgi:hypothetical protein